jgi:hypothetical protein
MTTETIRSTVYLEPELHQALRLKAAATRRTMSQMINDAVRTALREDQVDLAAFAERADEPSVSYEDFLERLRADGTL